MSADQVSKIESLAEAYAAGKGGSPRAFVDAAKRVAGPGAVAAVLPDIIGALPAGDAKKALFQLYSTEL
ncbi:hypothetical protein JKP88DRAFT_231056 [Tribonema minus]|uniref:Uncharacterized protein n=1 Tax=Tribonema minus TaxID=303371 RepID=A0A835ZDA1_9STRA|nr:hypothetical protein JKP88DRAFT_231056 [Tribonema minus]